MSRDIPFPDYVKAFDSTQTAFHITTDKMISMGMCACEKCGTICDIDYKFCIKCVESIMIVTKSK
jgi:hypothetical protein